MAQSAEIQIRVTDTDEFEVFVRAYRMMGRALKAISLLGIDHPALMAALDGAHIVAEDAPCWCDPLVSHVDGVT